METSSRNRSSHGTTLHSHFQRSLSPSGRFFPSSISASSAATFSARSDPRPGSDSVLARSTSPTRVSLGRSVSPSSSVRFSAPRRHPIASHHQKQQQSHRSLPKKTCMCSPTTHPGSFRCSLHKNSIVPGYGNQASPSSYRSSHQLNMRRSAMTNSLVRIGTVEGDLVKRALAALIRPSSHSLRRRHDFQPRPSRLSVMSKADGL
ncbi:hypothetical protein SASPL_110279 [Salvia splendens]|uniref:Serine-rich protein-like protein n=1 Tax=Salvia splendens TaxID=180675 RepID=A0A8X8Y9P0_SALSN|nr:uncharacterized protein LOC121801402 [Salvia splendens]KAG6426065.1 hypothetical protein SASPL_110279 [Salvia splendens]